MLVFFELRCVIYDLVRRTFVTYVISMDPAPDGVCKSVSGKSIAFDYEIAQKSKKRYQDKVRKHIDCIRQNNFQASPKYDHIHIVCDQQSVHKILSSLTAIYKGYFTIEMSGEILKRFQNSDSQHPPAANNFALVQ